MKTESKTPNPFDTQDPAGHRLAAGLAKISIALRQQAWTQALPRDLTPTQGQALVHLAQQPGSTLKELAATLAVRPSTASEAVSTLQSKELLRKQADPQDGRRIRLLLTQRGEREAQRARQWPDFLATVIEDLPVDEQATLMRVLQRLISELLKRGEISTARMCTTCRFFRRNAHPNAERRHHCAYVDAAFGDRDLRLDCPDHSDSER